MKLNSQRFVTLLFTLTTIGLLVYQRPCRDRHQVPSLDSSREHASSHSIVFAGIAGDSPRYIDSGTDRGTGWMDVRTLEVRKGLRLDGFEIQDEWLTPARIEHEIKLGNPICTYRKWKDPDNLFQQKQDRIYSLALDFEEEEDQKIIFKREKFESFKKYADPSGSLRLEALFQEPSLKTLVIKGVDYGKFDQQLFDVNSDNERVLKRAYARHIEQRVIKDHRQIIEMLNADRFDYIFADAIEDQDFERTKIPKERFIQIPYSAKRSTMGLIDPLLERYSFVCSLHPQTLALIPYINKWVTVIRGAIWKAQKADYRLQFERQRAGGYVPTLASVLLAGRFSSQLADGSADRWYALQQKQFSGLEMLPPRRESAAPSQTTSVRPQAGPLWYAVPYGQNGLVIANRTHFYRRLIEDADRVDRLFSNSNPAQGWSSRHLKLPFEVDSVLETFENRGDWSGGSVFKKLSIFEDPQRTRSLRSLSLMAGGLSDADAQILSSLLRSMPLEELMVYDASPEFTASVVNALMETPFHGLKSLDLTNSSLALVPAKQALLKIVSRSSELRSLRLDSTQIGEATWISLVDSKSPLRESLRELGATYLGPAWTERSVKAFAEGSWKSLVSLDTRGNGFFPQMFGLLLQGLPSQMEIIGTSSLLFPEIKKSFAEAFPRLRTLHLERTRMMMKQGKSLVLPASLRHLLFNQSEFQGNQIKLPPTIESFDISDSWFPTNGVAGALKRLGSRVKVLNLSKAGVSQQDVETLVQNERIQTIERLNLSMNQLDDVAVETLCRAKFKVERLDLSKNRIGNRGAAAIARCFLPSLKRLSLSENPIAEAGVRAIAGALPPQFESLDLSYVLALDAEVLFRSLPKSLKRLDLSGNLLSDHEAEMLAKGLPMALSDLDLSGTALSSRGMLTVVRALSDNLRFLSLTGIRMDPATLGGFFSALPPNLSELELGQVEFDLPASRIVAKRMPLGIRDFVIRDIQWVGSESEVEEAQKEFFTSVPVSVVRARFRSSMTPLAARGFGTHLPPHLRNLWLGGTGLKDEGMSVLISSLPSTLELLVLPANKLTDVSLEAISALPLENLFSLNLALNRFSEKGLKALCAKTRSLQFLNLTSTQLHPKDLTPFHAGCPGISATILIGNNPIGNEGLRDLFKRVSPHTKFINAPSTGLLFQGFDRVLSDLPTNLGGIELIGNDLGPLGYELMEGEVTRRLKRGHPFLILR